LAARPYKILICDDDDDFAEMLGEYLGMVCHCEVDRVTMEEDLWLEIAKDNFDVLLLDYHLPGSNGLDILKKITRDNINLPTVMMTGLGSEQIAARAIQSGAFDYLVKGQYAFSSLDGLIERAVQTSQLRRSMQESLKKIKYQANVLNGVRDAVIVWGVNGEITYWNRPAELLFGLDASQMVGQSVYEVYFPLFHPPYQFPLQFDEGIAQSERWFHVGEWDRVWVSSHISLLIDQDNSARTSGFMDVTRDITAQKQIEEKLQLRLQSEHLLSQLSAQFIDISKGEDGDYFGEALGRVCWQISAQVGIIFTCTEGHLTQVAASFEQSRAEDPGAIPAINLAQDDPPWRAAELRKRAIISVPSIEDLPRGTAMREYLLQRNMHTLVLIPLVSANDLHGVVLFGLNHWGGQWEIDYDYLLRTFGQILVRAMIQKQSSAKLLQSETRYRAIVEKHQTEMICRFTPDYSLSFVNEMYCQYYHLDRESLVGKSFLWPILQSDQEQLCRVIQDLSAETQDASVVFHIQIGSQLKWQEWTVHGIMDEQQKLVECQAVGRDITERKLMEDQIQAAQARLAQANRLASIGQLASSVAHQLSNPLTTIIGDAQLLLHNLDKENSDRESAQAIVDAGWRAQQVIDELLQFSASSEGDRKDVSLQRAIQKALLLSDPHIQDSGLELSVDLPAQELIVLGNEQQLADLCINMILAIVSQSETRKIRRMVIKGQLENGSVRLAFAHDGLPVTPEEAQTILEPQLIPTSAKWGTGMELSICREIVRQHGGAMIVTPKDNQTIYEITLMEGGTI
jgi:PAS domain S-box-containing protein